MERSGWNYPSGDIRLSDADRDRALAELHEALRDGRITADEFDERSAQALASRTGLELTALLADLPPVTPPAVRVAAPVAATHVFASRTAFAAAITAMCCSVLAVGAAVNHGPSPEQQKLIREWAARHGMAVPKGFPANPGFDWVGTIAPAVIAVVLVVLIICLRKRLAREDGS
ncbi:MAG TPA: DUF1707 domain-containing protein [Streptosporangiaceae bacterium]|jgi:hypothetical protein